jgi:hypothetical protein
MDIGFNQDSWLRRARPARDGARPQDGFDWHGLAARLAAAYALRRQLAETDILADAPSGSFDEEAASTIAAYEIPPAREWTSQAAAQNPATEGASLPVNRIGLDNRKAASGIHAGVAGPIASGDRGLK